MSVSRFVQFLPKIGLNLKATISQTQTSFKGGIQQNLSKIKPPQQRLTRHATESSGDPPGCCILFKLHNVFTTIWKLHTVVPCDTRKGIAHRALNGLQRTCDEYQLPGYSCLYPRVFTCISGSWHWWYCTTLRTRIQLIFWHERQAPSGHENYIRSSSGVYTGVCIPVIRDTFRFGNTRYEARYVKAS